MSQVYWFEKSNARRACPCLFLDRDGVIVEEVEYLHRPEDVCLLAGARKLIQSAHDLGWAVGVITNQAGVGRGYYDWTDFRRVQDEIAIRLDLGPEPFDFVAACASHPEAASAFQRVENHSWRKPNVGMILMASQALDLDLEASALVGDQLCDVRAAATAQIGRIFHIRTGHGAAHRSEIAAFAKEKQLSVITVNELADVVSQLAITSALAKHGVP